MSARRGFAYGVALGAPLVMAAAVLSGRLLGHGIHNHFTR